MTYLELAHRFEKESAHALRQGQRELAWALAHRAERAWDDYYSKEHRATTHRAGERFNSDI